MKTEIEDIYENRQENGPVRSMTDEDRKSNRANQNRKRSDRYNHVTALKFQRGGGWCGDMRHPRHHFGAERRRVGDKNKKDCNLQCVGLIVSCCFMVYVRVSVCVRVCRCVHVCVCVCVCVCACACVYMCMRVNMCP